MRTLQVLSKNSDFTHPTGANKFISTEFVADQTRKSPLVEA